MADKIELLDYYYLTVEPKPEAVAEILAALKTQRIGLRAFSSFPRHDRLQLDFVPSDGKALERLAKVRDWDLIGPKRVFLSSSDTDEPGKAAGIFERLSAAEIDVTALTAFGGECCHQLFWVPPAQVTKAMDVLQASIAPVPHYETPQVDVPH